MLLGVPPGPSKPSNFDVYLEPFLDELTILWEGITATDHSKDPPEEFTLRSTVLNFFLDGEGQVQVLKENGAGTYRGCYRCDLEGKC